MALDVVAALPVTDTQKRCLRKEVERYDNSTLEQIGEAQVNQTLDFTDPDALRSATPEMQTFVRVLRRCLVEER